MVASVPSSLQAALARLVAAEAQMLRPGQLVTAVVAGQTASGTTQLQIGDLLLTTELSLPLPAGTTLQLQVKSAGTVPQLVLVGQPVLPSAAGAVVPVAAPVPVQLALPVLLSAVDPNTVEAGTVALPTQGVAAETSQIELAGLPTAAGAVAGVAVDPLLAGSVATPSSPGATVVGSSGQPLALAGLSGVIALPVAQVPSGSGAVPVLVPMPQPGVALPVIEAELPGALPAAAASPALVPAAMPDREPSAGSETVALAMPAAAIAARLSAALATVLKLVPAPAASTVAASTVAAPPSTPAAALAQMIPDALARQDSAGPLLQSLDALLSKAPSLPETVLRAAVQVLAQRIVVAEGMVGGEAIRDAVSRSGLGLEAGLARGVADPADMKAGLLALRSALAKFLGETPPAAPSQHAAPPPLKGVPLRAPATEPIGLPDAPKDAARLLHGQADAAISRIKLAQFDALPDSGPRGTAPAMRTELPLVIGGELVMAQLEVARDGPRRRADRKRGWTMRLAMNFSGTGEVGAEVGLFDRSVSVALWAAEPETLDRLEAMLPELEAALREIGLDPGGVRLRNAPAPVRPQRVGRLLDAVS